MFSLSKNSGLRKWCVITAASMAGPLFAAAASAVTVQNGNSTLIINPTTPALDYTTAWIVDGVNQYGGSPAGGEQFYYSIGNTAPQPIGTLTNTNVFNSDGFYNAAYTGSGFTLSISETLNGGNPGTGGSSLVEGITIQNTTASALDFRLYEFTDFNVNATSNNDTLTLTGGNTANQTDPLGAVANVAVVSPTAYQIANDATIKDLLTGPSGVTLSDGATGPLLGNDNFAFEWEQDLAATNGSLNVSITQSITGGEVVPVPPAAWSALAMLAALSGFSLIRRLRKVAFA